MVKRVNNKAARSLKQRGGAGWFESRATKTIEIVTTEDNLAFLGIDMKLVNWDLTSAGSLADELLIFERDNLASETAGVYGDINFIYSPADDVAIFESEMDAIYVTKKSGQTLLATMVRLLAETQQSNQRAVIGRDFVKHQFDLVISVVPANHDFIKQLHSRYSNQRQRLILQLLASQQMVWQSVNADV